MTNNYIFQRLLSTFDLSRSPDTLRAVFKLGGQRQELSGSLIKSWRTHDLTSRHHRPMPDSAMQIFLDGLQEASKSGLIKIELND